jgi:Flp pilus assembly pilin Flp
MTLSSGRKESFSMFCFIRSLRCDDRGAAAVEYALICALVSVALISSLQGVATQLTQTFSRLSSAFPGN